MTGLRRWWRLFDRYERVAVIAEAEMLACLIVIAADGVRVSAATIVACAVGAVQCVFCVFYITLKARWRELAELLLLPGAGDPQRRRR